MLQNPPSGNDLPENQLGPLPDHQYDTVRHLVLGSLDGVQNTIKLLHKLNYADPNDWSRPLTTGRPNEVMAILTMRVRVS